MPIKRSHIAAAVLAGALAVVSSQLSAHHLSAHADCAAEGGRTGPVAACSFAKTDRLAGVPQSARPAIRQVGAAYLPDAGDAIDIREISKSRIDPANRAFIRVVSWIGVDAESDAAEERLAAN